MTYRELWQNIMNYGRFDRMPVVHWTGWDETLERWKTEGMPEGVNQHQFFNAVPHFTMIWTNIDLFPAFDEELIEDTDEYRIFRDRAGVIQQDWKHKSCIPHFIDFTLKEAKDWPEYKKRLQPDPARIPADIDERVRQVEASGLPIAVFTASMMGWIRNWMGVQNMSYLMFDAPDCYADMVMTLADLTCWMLDQVLPKLSAPADLGFGWEDICGKTGPLVSPSIFDRYVAPGYRKIRDKLEQHGVKMLGIDSDGWVEPLVEHWLDAGVNLQFPIEHGTWAATPEDIRRKFGPKVRILGGFDKLVLEHGRDAIDAEIEKHIPLMKEGGFIMMPDHLITPGVPLDDYRYYLDKIRELRF